MQDKIEQTLDIKASVSRVWQALTNHEQFGEWFGVKLNGPFVVNESLTGKVTHPGYEHMIWEATVKKMEPETYFAFAWCPFHEAEGEMKERETLVEFKLRATKEGTHLTLSESGFAAWPSDAKVEEAFQRNSEGWSIQAQSIARYVES